MSKQHKNTQDPTDPTVVREGSLIINADGTVVPTSSLVTDQPEGAAPTAGPEEATR